MIEQCMIVDASTAEFSSSSQPKVLRLKCRRNDMINTFQNCHDQIHESFLVTDGGLPLEHLLGSVSVKAFDLFCV